MQTVIKFGMVFGLAFLVPLSFAPHVQAQTAPNPKSLFKEAEIALKAGDVATACSKFQESYDIEPKFGRLQALADCRDREGRSATALELYHDYLTGLAQLEERERKNHAKRAAHAAERIRVLEVEVPRLKLVWRGPLDENVDVQVDGRDALPKLNTEWQLDPGDHVVTVRKKDAPDKSQKIKLVNGEPMVEMDLTPPEKPPAPVQPPLDVSEVTQPEKPKSTAELQGPPIQQSMATKPSQSYVLSQRHLGFMWLGVGGLGAGIAAGLAYYASTYTAVIDAKCSPTGSRVDTCAQALNDGYAWGNAATAALVVGGALATVGVVELWGRGTSKPVSPSAMRVRFGVGAQHGVVAVEGRF